MATAKKTAPAPAKPVAKAVKAGTALATRKPTSGAIVDIQAQLRAQAAAMNDRTAPASGIYIRATQDKKFNTPDGQVAEELELVVVDFVTHNEFYEGKYDPKNIVPPICVAIGSNPQKLVPSDNSPNKQADTCAECPMNAFGSDGDGKACKNTRVLAVLPAGGEGDEPLWLLKVSPTALKGFDAFVRGVASTLQAPPVAVKVKVSFDEAVTYARLKFSDIEPNELVGIHLGRQKEAQELLSQEPDMTPREAPAKPSKAPARRPATAKR